MAGQELLHGPCPRPWDLAGLSTKDILGRSSRTSSEMAYYFQLGLYIAFWGMLTSLECGLRIDIQSVPCMI